MGPMGWVPNKGTPPTQSLSLEAVAPSKWDVSIAPLPRPKGPKGPEGWGTGAMTMMATAFCDTSHCIA